MSINADFSQILSNFNANNNYTKVVVGAFSKVLETEINEYQDIQNYLRKQFMDLIFVKNKFADFSWSITNNVITLAGTMPVIDGFLNVNTTVSIPVQTTAKTLHVYVKYYKKTISYNDTVRLGGNETGTIIENKILDSRLKKETTKRDQLCYAVEVGESVPVNDSIYSYVNIFTITARANQNILASDIALDNVVKKPIPRDTADLTKSDTYTKTEVDALLANLLATSAGLLKTLQDLATVLAGDEGSIQTILDALAKKVDKADGYRLMSNLEGTIIANLAKVAKTGEYSDLLNIPTSFHAGSGNCDTISGVGLGGLQLNMSHTAKSANDLPSTWENGIYYSPVHDNGYPCLDGVLLTIKGATGDSIIQILTEWKNIDGASGKMWFRSKRDSGANIFSDFSRIVTSDEALLNKDTQTITKNGSTGVMNAALVAKTTDGSTPFVGLYDSKNNLGASISYTNNEVEIRDINGSLTNFKAAKIYGAWYNDYAEYYLKDEEVEAGDIISKNPNGEGYTKSTKAYDRRVCGVVSSKETYFQCIGGEDTSIEENEKKYAPVALAGRIPVKVVGEVKIGQFIVPSDVPGVGIGIYDYIPGCIVGKALENYSSNEVGKILIQVMNI